MPLSHKNEGSTNAASTVPNRIVPLGSQDFKKHELEVRLNVD